MIISLSGLSNCGKTVFLNNLKLIFKNNPTFVFHEEFNGNTYYKDYKEIMLNDCDKVQEKICQDFLNKKHLYNVWYNEKKVHILDRSIIDIYIYQKTLVDFSLVKKNYLDEMNENIFFLIHSCLVLKGNVYVAGKICWESSIFNKKFMTNLRKFLGNSKQINSYFNQDLPDYISMIREFGKQLS